MSNPDNDGNISDYLSDDGDQQPSSPSSHRATEEASAVGLLPDGSRFTVPHTMSVLAALVKPKSWKSPAVLLWIFVCLATLSTGLLYLRGYLPQCFFIFLFVFWRLGYNAGLGYLLRTQSNQKQFLKWYQQLVKPSVNKYRTLLESSVVFEDDKVTYKVENFPDEFNAWMLFRFVVMVVLALDVVSYFLMVGVYWEAPDFSSPFEILSWIVGLSLIVFAIWSKADAHRVIGDYAWYWGDFFFLLDKHLVFDGIFQMFPHPMYTVGYAFMYGFPLMAKSYTVFYLSLFGHVSQFVFLTFVENPHIDKTYNALSEPSEEERARDAVLYNDGYFNKDKKDLVVVKNFDPFRTTDVLLVVLLCYLFVAAFVLEVPVWLLIVHYAAWRLFLNAGLGWVLHRQSTTKYWTHGYYHSPQEAFSNWKRIYNTAVVMTNTSFCVCAFKFFVWTSELLPTSDVRLLIFTIGVLLVGINVYVSLSVYEVLGDFGYFYGDFFIDDVPAKLDYSGIYRYLNNPDSSLGLLSYYGVCLMSGNLRLLPIAIASHVCVKLFERFVETPHMAKKYGALRKAGGLRSEVKKKLRQAKVEYEVQKKRLTEEMERRKREIDAMQAQARSFSRKKKE